MTAITPTADGSLQRSPLGWLGLVGHQFRFDLIGFTRNRQARFATVFMPVFFLVIFIALFGNGMEQLPSGAMVKVATYYIPGLTAFGIISAAYSSLLVAVVRQREHRILKRRRATPLPACSLITSRTQ